MSENLINDLLDLAKLDNNRFSFTKDYFDLPATIYQAFDMVLNAANDQKISLKAEIDNKQHLDLFQRILGD